MSPSLNRSPRRGCMTEIDPRRGAPSIWIKIRKDAWQKHPSYTTSVRPQLPPFPPGSSPSTTPSTSISWIFQPTTKHVWDYPWNMLRTRPLSTHNYPLSPRIISICNPFNLNFLDISAHNEACLRLTLKHASYTPSVHPQLPPFPPGSSPSQPLQPQFPEYFSPLRNIFETNPKICFVNSLCPPTITSRPNWVSLPSLFRPHPSRPPSPIHTPSTPSLASSIHTPVHTAPHPVSLPSLFRPPPSTHSLAPSIFNPRPRPHPSHPSHITPIPFSTPIPYHAPIAPIPYHIHLISNPSRSIIIYPVHTRVLSDLAPPPRLVD